MNYRYISILSIIIVFSAFACEGANDDTSTDVITQGDQVSNTWDGVCTNDRDGWKKCEENRIQWCHVLEGMTPHFHEGLDCDALGLTCVEQQANDDGVITWTATCVDETATCAEGDFRCEDNTAMNCIDGAMGVEPCGTMTCHEEADHAHCEEGGEEECGGHGHLDGDECHCDENYAVDPNDSTMCVATLSFPELVCSTYAAGKDSIDGDHHLDATDTMPGPHAHLDEVMSVHLLAANTSNYIHFPVSETGEYVLFLDTASVVANFYDKDGQKVPYSNPGPNDFCTDDLVDHFHISATYSGDGTDPVPTIIEFHVKQDVEVRFLVKLHEE